MFVAHGPNLVMEETINSQTVAKNFRWFVAAVSQKCSVGRDIIN